MKYIFVVLGFVVLSVGGYYFYQTQQRSMPDVSNERVSQVYVNEVHGYSLEYADTLSVREYSPDVVTFGVIEGEAIDGVVEARVLTVQGEGGGRLEDVVINELLPLCAADAPSISYSCVAAEEVEPFVTVSGVEGFVVNLRGELKNFETNETIPRGKGPFFVVPLMSSATGSKVLVIHAPLDEYADESDAQLIRNTALSVDVRTETIAGDSVLVSEHISQNISELSPVKATMGGTFYVTALETRDGSGIVAYEDGHNAYTADFDYTITGDGTVSVTRFVVRD